MTIPEQPRIGNSKSRLVGVTLDGTIITIVTAPAVLLLIPDVEVGAIGKGVVYIYTLVHLLTPSSFNCGYIIDSMSPILPEFALWM